jgi:hypothetical protein
MLLYIISSPLNCSSNYKTHKIIIATYACTDTALVPSRWRRQTMLRHVLPLSGTNLVIVWQYTWTCFKAPIARSCCLRPFRSYQVPNIWQSSCWNRKNKRFLWINSGHQMSTRNVVTTLDSMQSSRADIRIFAENICSRHSCLSSKMWERSTL